MKFPLIIAAISLCCQGLSAEIEARAVHMFWQPSLVVDSSGARPANGDLYKNMVVWLYLTYHGSSEVKLPTENFSVAVGDHKVKGFCVINYLFGTEGNPLKITPVLPESKLSVVCLKDGETAIIRYEATVDEKALKELKMTYEVPKEFAQRYGLWSGRLEVISRTAAELGLNQ